MASYETLLLERRGRVAVITINRPDKMNALNIQTRQEGAAALDELRDDEEVRVVVITGAGPKSFVAGADISEFAGRTAPVMTTTRTSPSSRSSSTAAAPSARVWMLRAFILSGRLMGMTATRPRRSSSKVSYEAIVPPKKNGGRRVKRAS